VKLRKPSLLVFKTINFCGKLSFVLSFLSFCLSASTAGTCIFTDHTCTTTIVSLEPCALNAEFQHFVLSSTILYWDLIKCPYFANTTEREDGGWKDTQRQGEDRVTLPITNPGTTIHYHPMNGITSHPTEYKVGIPRSHGCWNPQNWRWGNLKFLVSFGTPFSTLAPSPWYYLGRYGKPDKNAIENNIQKWEKDKSNMV
jgi:hypothetical protein